MTPTLLFGYIAGKCRIPAPNLTSSSYCSTFWKNQYVTLPMDFQQKPMFGLALMGKTAPPFTSEESVVQVCQHSPPVYIPSIDTPGLWPISLGDVVTACV